MLLEMMAKRRRKERDEYRSWPNGYYHLSTDGWKEGRLFHHAGQYAFGMIVLGVLTFLFGIKIYACSLMPNHVHIILSGTGGAILKAFDYLRRQLSARLVKDGYPPLPEDYWFKLVSIDDEEQMRNNFIYVDRNPHEKQICVPVGYPWGSNPLHFSLLGTMIKGRRADTFSRRELMKLTCTEKPIPPDWEFHPELGLLPKFFIDNSLFLKLFKSPKAYESRLVKDYEAFVQVARTLDEEPDYSPEDYFVIVTQLLQTEYKGRRLYQLSSDEKGKMVVLLANRYGMNAEQIAHAMKMSLHLVQQFLRAKDYGHQQ